VKLIKFLQGAVSSTTLPCAFDFEGAKVIAFGLDECMFHDSINATAARPFAERSAQLSQVFVRPGNNDLDVSIFRVANPAFKVKFAGLAMNEPAEPHALYPAFDEKM
jgi:hypothetical protein